MTTWPMYCTNRCGNTPFPTTGFCSTYCAEDYAERVQSARRSIFGAPSTMSDAEALDEWERRNAALLAWLSDDTARERARAVP